MSCDDSEQHVTFHTIDSRNASHPTPKKTSTWIQVIQEAYQTFVSKCFPDEELEPFEVWERLLLRPSEHAKYRLSISVGLVTVEHSVTESGGGGGGGGVVVERCAGISVVEIYDSSQSLWLAYLAVDEAFRRFGIAKRLIALAAQLLCSPTSTVPRHTSSLGAGGGGPPSTTDCSTTVCRIGCGHVQSDETSGVLVGSDPVVPEALAGNAVPGGGGRVSQLCPWVASAGGQSSSAPPQQLLLPQPMQQLFLCAKRCHGGADAVAPQLRHRLYRNAGFVPFQFDYFDCGRLRSMHPSALAVYRPDRSPLHASVNAVDGPDGTAFAYPGPPLYRFIKDLYEATLAEEGKSLTFELHLYESLRDAQSVALCCDSFWT